ncbi:MAG: hypothetical protein KBD01_18140 [Acidobacteria bacterium]|nr:hypothetical protein [Acidobacteriota bacterium]
MFLLTAAGAAAGSSEPVYLITGPLVTALWAKLLVVLAAYALAVSLSGPIVRFFVLPRVLPPLPPRDRAGPRFDSSSVIGKCENIIAVSLILLGEETGLALIFTAKSLVRSDDIKRNPGFYLGGTLVNFVWSVLVAGIARVLVAGF